MFDFLLTCVKKKNKVNSNISINNNQNTIKSTKKIFCQDFNNTSDIDP